jgi:iron complex transport system substrate-binding protein
MKRIAAAALLLLTASAAAATPARIMSLKVCTDALLMDLVPPSRIASVTFLSREPAALKFWPQAAHIPINHGTVEEVLAVRPDLILTDTFTPPATRALLLKSGARLVEVPPAEDFAAIRAVTRQVAGAVGAEARGEALVARMDRQLAALASRRPRVPPRVVAWGGGGYVPGRGTLFDAALKAAGARNLETGPVGYFDVESLIAAGPDVLAYGDAYRGTASLRADQDNHPALMARYAGRRVTYDSALLSCGVPESAGAALRLQAALIAAVKR